MDFLAVGQRLSGLIEDRFTPTESEGYDESEEPEEPQKSEEPQRMEKSKASEESELRRRR